MNITKTIKTIFFVMIIFIAGAALAQDLSPILTNDQITISGLTYKRVKITEDELTSYTWIGAPINKPELEVAISIDKNLNIHGRLYNHKYELVQISGKLNNPIIREIKQIRKMPEHGEKEDGFKEEDLVFKKEKFRDKSSITQDEINYSLKNITQTYFKKSAAQLNKSAAGIDTIDILALYTSGITNAESVISNLNSIANSAHSASGTNVRLRVIGAALVNYTENNSNSTALNDLTNGSGVFANVTNMRNTVGADIVVLLRPLKAATQGGCGIAWLAPPSTHAYGVISTGVSGSYYCDETSYSHEIGHILGAAHDRANAANPGKYSFSYGYGFEGIFGTIMSYISPTVNRFSSPLITCAGLPCGIAVGMPGEADNVETFKRTSAAIASWKNPTGVVLPPPVVTCTYSVSPTTLTMSPGESKTINVSTASDCAWSVSGGSGWVGYSPSSSTGPGTVTVTSSSNSVGQNLTLTIADKTVSISIQANPPPSPPASSDSCEIAGPTSALINKSFSVTGICNINTTNIFVYNTYYYWYVNGTFYGGTVNPDNQFTFDTPGSYSIQLITQLLLNSGSSIVTKNIFSNKLNYTLNNSIVENVDVIEYILPAKNHYFLTANPDEIAWIDNGGAGPWTRTGVKLKLWATKENVISGTLIENLYLPVCRFYNHPPVTHFYTSDKAECDYLKTLNPTNSLTQGWVFEGDNAFLAIPPNNNLCAEGYFPVWRFYNNRATQNDSNHRFVTNQQDYQTMLNNGWIAEGLAFCQR